MSGITVIVETQARTYTLQAASGATLLQAIRAAGGPYGSSCMHGSCGKCQCQVLEGADSLQRPMASGPEQRNRELDRGFRLACQARVVGPGPVRIRQR